VLYRWFGVCDVLEKRKVGGYGFEEAVSIKQLR
jgi:hypothetical protein